MPTTEIQENAAGLSEKKTAHPKRFTLAEKQACYQALRSNQRRKLAVAIFGVFLVFSAYLFVTAGTLYADRSKDTLWWEDAHTVSDEMKARVRQVSSSATVVSCGTYVELLDNISLRDSTYTLTMELWFRWQGDAALDMAHNFRIYGGQIINMEMLKETHSGNDHYQRVRLSAVMDESYWTKRFPLDSHVISCYVESAYPIEKVLLQTDTKNSDYNRFLTAAGYKIDHVEVNTFYFNYLGTHGDPEIKDEIITSEVVTSIGIKRDGMGLYAKCFIALVGTLTWIILTLYINTYHNVDPLNMIPGALFGTVSNILVGANLLPDALQFGLLEYVNVYGIMLILAASMSIITVNRIRNKDHDDAFAALFGRTLFGLIIFFTVVGNVLLPWAAYLP
ncbi:MAG: hypothetical protein RR951_06620 [Ruthenibacterium sp.]